MNIFDKIRNKWKKELEVTVKPADVSELERFNKDKLLPEDLKKYFLTLNGTGEDYDENLFQFYSINNFKTVSEEFKRWSGIPNYKEIFDTLSNPDDYYVFANYHFYLFSYAIKLPSLSDANCNVLCICGGEFKIVAKNFTEFLHI